MAYCTQTFRTTPVTAGDHFSTVSLKAANLPETARRTGHRGSAAPRCLLVGFDTEYQSMGTVTSTQISGGEAHNEVLSYQFVVKFIERYGDTPTQLVAGVIVPEEGKRLLLADFIVSAVASFVGTNPDVVLPAAIYLVGHFTRADIPAFSDFQDAAKTAMKNLRGTFVSQNIGVNVEGDGGAHLGKLDVALRDTMLLAPGNAKSLEGLGELVGIKKLKLADDAAAELAIKENMKQFRQADWEAFRAYAIRDAEICVDYAERIIRQHDAMFGEFTLPLTLSQFGMAKVLQGWVEREWNRTALIGREESKAERFDKRRGKMITRTDEVYLEDIYFDLDFVTETYQGGRNEQFAFGICEEGCWRDHDLSSAYTTAMSLIGYPDWASSRQLDTLELLLATDLAFASVDFEFPTDIRYPTLPVRTQNGIIFPRKGRSFCAAPEIVLAQKLGANLSLRRGVRVDHKLGRPIFKDFIVECIAERAKHDKKTFDNLLWKEIGNSTYGKVAQGLRGKRVFDLRDNDMIELPESKLTQPHFASFITSFVRAVLGEILNAFPQTVQVFSVTTDGFLSNATDQDIEQGKSGAIFKTFAKARRALDPNSQPLEIKHEIRQPIGWRTRGSATLKPGTASSDSIVLQKGGIKTNRFYDTAQDNRFITELFLNRRPDQMLDYTSGIGIRDVVRFGADFGTRSVTKRLSMEFDWKRKPKDPCERTVDFNGTRYTHLSYDTTPVEDKSEFDTVREAWKAYTSKKAENLKTFAAFQNFQRYLETQERPANIARYARTSDGSIKRLRLCLTRAFKHQQAGFDAVVAAGRIPTHKSFRDTLIACGIPCTLADIDNGKKFDFVPRHAFRVEETLMAIEKLKQLYPEMEVDEILEGE